MTVKRATLLNETRTTSPPLFLKMGEGRLKYIIAPKCRTIIPLLKEYFPFSYVAPFGYDNAAKEGTVKFLVKFRAISPSPQNRGTRRRIQAWDIKIIPYPQLFATYS